MLNTHARWIGLVVAAMTLSGCGGGEVTERHHAHNGDLRESTASAGELPDFLEGQREEIRLVYRAAAEAAGLLEGMPCYCGCGESAGHASNRDCFIHEIREDGSILWDDHGTRCGVCLDIAAESIDLKLQGKSDREIRQHIDDKYKEGYTKPTATPMPA